MQNPKNLKISQIVLYPLIFINIGFYTFSILFIVFITMVFWWISPNIILIWFCISTIIALISQLYIWKIQSLYQLLEDIFPLISRLEKTHTEKYLVQSAKRISLEIQNILLIISICRDSYILKIYGLPHNLKQEIILWLEDSEIIIRKHMEKTKYAINNYLTEQEKILIKAKSEVEKNITWTPELLNVSEAQKMRLDRQIEQFEELQKRLKRI